MKVREYGGPLGILAAGAIGISLLCSVSAMAMTDISNYVPMTRQPLNIVDLAFSNFETAAALTEQMVTVFVPTATIQPTNTPSFTPLQSDTSTSVPTKVLPTRTRRPRATVTPTNLPTRTSIPPTAIPSRTNTPVPPTATRTHTAVPSPTDTDTPIPPTVEPDPPTPQDTDTPPPTVEAQATSTVSSGILSPPTATAGP